MVRREVTYKGKSFPQKSRFDPDQNFVKCPKLVREVPRAIHKIKRNIGDPDEFYGPGDPFGATLSRIHRILSFPGKSLLSGLRLVDTLCDSQVLVRLLNREMLMSQ